MSRFTQYNRNQTYQDNFNYANQQRQRRVNEEQEEIAKEKIAMDKLKNELEMEKQMEKDKKAKIRQQQYEDYSNYIKQRQASLPEERQQLNIKLGGEERSIKKQNYNQQMDNLCLNPTRQANAYPTEPITNFSEAGRNYQRGYSHGYNILTGEIFTKPTGQNNIKPPSSYVNESQVPQVGLGDKKIDAYPPYNNENISMGKDEYGQINNNLLQPGIRENINQIDEQIPRFEEPKNPPENYNEEDYKRYLEYMEGLKQKEAEEQAKYYAQQQVQSNNSPPQGQSNNIPPEYQEEMMKYQLQKEKEMQQNTGKEKPIDTFDEYYRQKGILSNSQDNIIPSQKEELTNEEQYLLYLQQQQMKEMENNPQLNNESNQKQSYHKAPEKIESNDYRPTSQNQYNRNFNQLMDTRAEYLQNKQKNNTSYDNVFRIKQPQLPPKKENEPTSKYGKEQIKREYARFLEGQINAKKVYEDTMKNLSKGSEPVINVNRNDNFLYGGFNPYQQIREKKSKLNDIPQDPYSSKKYNIDGNSYLSSNPITNPNSYQFSGGKRRTPSGRLQNSGNNVISQK